MTRAFCQVSSFSTVLFHGRASYEGCLRASASTQAHPCPYDSMPSQCIRTHTHTHTSSAPSFKHAATDTQIVAAEVLVDALSGPLYMVRGDATLVTSLTVSSRTCMYVVYICMHACMYACMYECMHLHKQMYMYTFFPCAGDFLRVYLCTISVTHIYMCTISVTHIYMCTISVTHIYMCTISVTYVFAPITHQLFVPAQKC
jgi:hypothetical protein